MCYTHVHIWCVWVCFRGQRLIYDSSCTTLQVIFWDRSPFEPRVHLLARLDASELWRSLCLFSLAISSPVSGLQTYGTVPSIHTDTRVTKSRLHSVSIVIHGKDWTHRAVAPAHTAFVIPAVMLIFRNFTWLVLKFAEFSKAWWQISIIITLSR